MLISKYGGGSATLVKEFENKYGIEIDEHYRNFLIRYNGGDTPKTMFRIKGFSSDIRYLFGINTRENVEDHLNNPMWQDKKYLPIGEDSFGNYYVMGTSAADKGTIFFCDHEKGFQIKRIADTFLLFISKCKSDEINPRAKWTPEEREARLVAEGKAGNITDGLRALWRQEYEKYKDMIQEKVIVG